MLYSVFGNDEHTRGEVEAMPERAVAGGWDIGRWR